MNIQKDHPHLAEFIDFLGDAQIADARIGPSINTCGESLPVPLGSLADELSAMTSLNRQTGSWTAFDRSKGDKIAIANWNLISPATNHATGSGGLSATDRYRVRWQAYRDTNTDAFIYAEFRLLPSPS